MAAARRPHEGHWITVAFLRLIAWFMPPVYADLPHIRQHTAVFIGSLLASGPVTLGLGLVAFLVVPPQFALLPWAVLMTMGFALCPFLVKWFGRVDLVAALVVQLISLAVLAIAHFYGGVVSPALPWLMVALIAACYWLEPWSLWRNINLALFAAEVVAFTLIHIYTEPVTQIVSDHALLIMLFCSSTAVFVFTQFVLVMVWSMNRSKQRQLRREVEGRRATETELRIGREHLARAQAIGKIGSAETNLTTNETKWSSEHYRLLGLMPDTAGSVIDLLLAAVHKDDREWVAALLDREAGGELTQPVEFRIVRPDGEIRWLRRQPQFISDAYGVPASLFVTVQDVTEWRTYQEERVSLERQLFQAQKLEAVGKLAGGVAHDFNNLLAVISARMEMLDEELNDRPKLRDWIRSAKQAAERGAHLTDMMLSFARRQPLQPMEIDPSLLLPEISEMLRRTLGETIQVDQVSEPDSWSCEVDPDQLQSALLNLAVNARDAMPNGGTLTIATYNVQLDAVSAGMIPGAKPGDYVVVAVTDTGIGMTPDVIERAFEPFFTTKDGRSSGLGLSMVSGFVAQSGGHVEIASEVGRGTTVSIYLPRVSEEKSPALYAGASLGPKSILLVEDNDEVRDVTTLQLERMGYTVLTAATGAGGLAKLNAHPEVELLLSDIVLPGGMDGVEMAKQAFVARPDLRVVFMSGYSTHRDLPALGVNGSPRLLRKPFEKSELAREIRAAFE